MIQEVEYKVARKIAIHAGSVVVTAEINSSATANAIWEALPIKSIANTWGQEIYFTIPVTVGPENGREIVNNGEIAYWPPGKAFCIFFGPTPASRGKEIRAASAVNVFGKIEGNPQIFSSIMDGENISIARLQ